MTYQEAIKSAPVVLVEFYASWCPHCQHMMPIVAQVKEVLEGKAAVVQYDIDKNKEYADENHIEGIPTFIIYKNGEQQWRQSGEMPGEELLSQVEKYL